MFKFYNPFARIRSLEQRLSSLRRIADHTDESRKSWIDMFYREANLAEQARREANQVILAHMDDREDLKAAIVGHINTSIEMMSIADAFAERVTARDETIESLLTTISDVGNELITAEDEVEELNAIILQASLFVGRAKEQLATIGITVETGEDGAPAMTIDTNTLLSFVDLSVPRV